MADEELTHAIELLTEALKKIGPPEPPDTDWFKLTTKGTSDATGRVVIEIGPAPRGWMWDLRLVVVHGWVGDPPNPTTAVAGSVVIYEGAPSPHSMIDFSTAIPDVSSWPAGPPEIGSDEPMTVVFAGTPPATDLFVNCYFARRLGKKTTPPDPQSGEAF